MTRVQSSKSRTAGYGLALTLGLAVAAAGYISSFANLATYASSHGFPQGWLLPIGLDLGIPALLILDWLRPSLFLRATAWALAGGTVLANAAVAGGTWTDRALHAVMPAVAILIVEAGRHLQDDPSRMDKIRLSRWLLSPVRTARLKRRMVLWEVTSYSDALTRESAILHARTVLQSAYRKPSWRATRKVVPATLLHQISTGQMPFAVLHGHDLQTSVRDWVYATLEAIAATPSPVTPVSAETRTDRIDDSVEVEQDPWVTIWVARDSLLPEGVPAPVFALAIDYATRTYTQVGKLPTIKEFRTELNIAQARAAAISRALQSALDGTPVTATEAATETDSRQPVFASAHELIEFAYEPADTARTASTSTTAPSPA